MYERLGEAILKSGQRMEIGVVAAPDAAWRDRIAPFLSHKSEPYASHIRRSLQDRLDELQTLYYIGHLEGRIITEVMIAGARGAGILGHVYTVPEERRKGAYQAVMAEQMADVERKGFRLLSLGTGFESPAYWIYHRFGFRSIGPGRGEMRWASGEKAEAELFRPGVATARDARWDDWGCVAWLGLLPVAPEEELPRSRVMRLNQRGIMESPYIRLLLTRERESQMSVRVLQSSHGATVAWAILSPDPAWFSDAWMLDLHIHPSFCDSLPLLLEGLSWPNAPVGAGFTGTDGPKARALTAAGFTRSAELPGWLRSDDGRRRDVGFWIRA